MVRDAQRGAGVRELADPVAAELVRGVGGEQRQLGRDDLALLTQVQVTRVTDVSGAAA